MLVSIVTMGTVVNRNVSIDISRQVLLFILNIRIKYGHCDYGEGGDCFLSKWSQLRLVSGVAVNRADWAVLGKKEVRRDCVCRNHTGCATGSPLAPDDTGASTVLPNI